VNTGREVSYWRAEPWEVDAVIVEGKKGYLIEIKTGRYAAGDLRGLTRAARTYPELTPVVLCGTGEEKTAADAGFRAVAWTDFLLDAWS
jgi:hypothetical protein